MRLTSLSILFTILFTNPVFSQIECLFIDSMFKYTHGDAGFISGLSNDARLGHEIDNIGDLNGDGVDDFVISAFGDSDGGPYKGSVFILFMNANGTVNSHQKISSTTGNLPSNLLLAGEHFGSSTSDFVDYNNDGVQDILVGGAFRSNGTGACYIVELNSNGTANHAVRISDSFGFNFSGDNLGSGIASIGDVNNDGIADFAVGAKRADYGGTESGAVHVVLMDTGYTVKSVTTISRTSGGMNNQIGIGSWFGTSISSTGDMNGDGVPDMIVGAAKDNTGGALTGAAYILYLDTTGSVINHVKIHGGTGGMMNGLISADDRFGYSVKGRFDLNGDGVKDLLIGSQQDDDGGLNNGAIYCLYMKSDGTLKDYFKLSELTSNFSYTLSSNGSFGKGVTVWESSPNQIDVIVTAPRDDQGGNNTGAMYRVRMENYLPLEINATDTVICQGDSISLTASGYANFTWLGGVQNGVGFIPTSSGNYSVYMTDPYGCSDTTEQYITVHALPSLSKNVSAILCNNQTSLVLNHISPTGGTYSGLGVSNNEFFANGSGAYPVQYTLTDSLGCTSILDDTIIVSEGPSALISPIQDFCYRDTSIVLSGLPLGGTFVGAGVSTGLYNPSSQNFGINSLSYVVTDSIGCADTASTSFLIDTVPNLTLTPDLVVCKNDPISLSATGAPSILWNTGLTGPILDTVAEYSTFYFVLGTTQLNICQEWDTIKVTVNEPNPNLGPDLTAYVDSTVSIQADSGYTSYFWHDGSTAQNWSGTFNSAGLYTVHTEVIDSTGCIGSDTVEVSITVNGLNENSTASSLRLYPNPASNDVNIVGETNERVEVSIYSDNGAIVHNEATGLPVKLNSSSWAKGVYTVHIARQSAIEVRKLIIR